MAIVTDASAVADMFASAYEATVVRASAAAVEAALAISNIAINQAAVTDSAVIKAEAVAANAEQSLKLAMRKIKTADRIVAGK